LSLEPKPLVCRDIPLPLYPATKKIYAPMHTQQVMLVKVEPTTIPRD